MPDKSRTVTRQELFDQVWLEPMTKLAPKYGLSDVGLAKVCKKHQIPKPPVGHWAKLAHGKASPKPKLPKLDAAHLEEIHFTRSAEASTNRAEKEEVNIPEIVVRDDLRGSHKLVTQACASLQAAALDDRGVLKATSRDGLQISVTKKSLTRALRILNALMLHWESAGGTVTASDNGVCFSRDDDGVTLSISERVRRHEKQKQTRYFKEYTYEPTGHLTISLYGLGVGRRSNWSDGKIQRLETLLGEVVVNLERGVSYERTRRLDNECAKRQNHAVQKIREARKAIKEQESERIQHLDGCVDRWIRATQIRSYLAALDDKLANIEVQPADQDKFPKWRLWAQWYADSVCPITPTPPRHDIGEQVVSTNKQIKDLDLTPRTRRALEQARIIDTDELSSLTREQLQERCGDAHRDLLNETSRVLEGLGYEVESSPQ